jgi:3-hydroxyacyl-CoA dehydrogenase
MAFALGADIAAGVIGAGTMGAGIAQVAASQGHRTVLADASATAVAKAKDGHVKAMARDVEKGRRTRAEADAVLARITYVNGVAPSDLEAFAGCGLVIEAIVEDLAVKQTLFRSLEAVVAREAVLATNTSSLSIAAIAGGCQHAERVVGIHFFNPAPVMALVELIPALATDRAVLDASRALVERWGKVPVVASDTPGFIVNRIARPFYGESLRILEEGIADVATIDWAMRTLGGFKMGPFELMDLIGNDVNYAVTRSVFEAMYFDPRYRPVADAAAPRGEWLAWPQGEAGLLRLSRWRGRAEGHRGRSARPHHPGPRRGDAHQRGRGCRAAARRFARGHRARDDQGRELSARPAQLGRRTRPGGGAGHARVAAAGVWRGSLPPEPAAAPRCQRRREAAAVSAQDVIARMFAQDAFSQWLGVQVLEVREGYCRSR